MNKQQEALKLALEALEYLRKPIAQGWEAETQQEKRDQAITAIREALAEQPAQQHIEYCLWARNGHTPCPHVQPAHQEPVAWISESENLLSWDKFYDHMTPLYTSPPASKPWVGLSTIELDEIDAPIRERGHATIAEIYRAIEAKLREKNA